MSSTAPVQAQPSAVYKEQKAGLDGLIKKFGDNEDKMVNDLEFRNKQLNELRSWIGQNVDKDFHKEFHGIVDEIDNQYKAADAAAANPTEAASLDEAGNKPKVEMMTITQKLIKLLQEAHERYLALKEQGKSPYDPMVEKVRTAAEKARETWKKAVGNEQMTDDSIDALRKEVLNGVKEEHQEDVKKAFNNHFNEDVKKKPMTKRQFKRLANEVIAEVGKAPDRFALQQFLSNKFNQLKQDIFNPTKPNLEATATENQRSKAATVSESAVNQETQSTLESDTPIPEPGASIPKQEPSLEQQPVAGPTLENGVQQAPKVAPKVPSGTAPKLGDNQRRPVAGAAPKSPAPKYDPSQTRLNAAGAASQNPRNQQSLNPQAAATAQTQSIPKPAPSTPAPKPIDTSGIQKPAYNPSAEIYSFHKLIDNLKGHGIPDRMVDNIMRGPQFAVGKMVDRGSNTKNFGAEDSRMTLEEFGYRLAILEKNGGAYAIAMAEIKIDDLKKAQNEHHENNGNNDRTNERADQHLSDDVKQEPGSALTVRESENPDTVRLNTPSEIYQKMAENKHNRDEFNSRKEQGATQEQRASMNPG